MKRISIIKTCLFLLISVITCFTTTLSFAGKGTPFKQIVFFGDSLSDDGNLFSVLFKYLPKSPPYFDGRFSNGAVWSEHIATEFSEKYGITTANFAYGGQTTVFHNPVEGYLPYTLGFSVEDYLMRSVFRDRAHNLFVIWIGANDYLRGANDTEELTTAVTNKIKETIASLIYHGGKNFLVINLPDLSRTPYAVVNHSEQNLQELSLKHNAKLQTAITELQEEYKELNIQLYDVNALFRAVINDTDEHNRKYHLNLINTKDSCWEGGYTVAKRKGSEKAISADFTEYLQQQAKLTSNPMIKRLNSQEIAKFIVDSPDLYEAYAMNKNIVVNGKRENKDMCVNPDQYFFWDHVHPTHMVHDLFAKIMFEYIDRSYQHI